MTPLPRTYSEFRDYWRRRRAYLEQDYGARRHSWLVGALPPDVLALSVPETLGILQERHGSAVDAALAAEHSNPDRPVADLPSELRGPIARESRDPDWIRRANVVGINIRTVGSFFGVVKYLLSVPNLYDAVHLLPIWEPGVVGSLYGMSSWEINGEFFDPALAEEYPHLNTAGRQLRAVTNLIHVTGRALGMDVIPHTDRFSEIAIAQPALFEWIRREDTDIVDRRSNLHEEVEERILDYIDAHGPATGGYSRSASAATKHGDAADGDAADAGRADWGRSLPARASFFSPAVAEAERNRILFGDSGDPQGRAARRGEIVHFIHAYGFEPAPATMAPPYRGLVVDLENRSVDGDGDVWRDYKIAEPQSMSRVFGPLARYKLYDRLNDNWNWEVDFSSPRREVWDYVCGHYLEVQRRYGFDFMRGDMSHVQMRADGVPVDIGPYYDLHAAVKRRIREDAAPYFAYFAETFMAPRGIMGYGDEVDHLDASDAEVTLGDLQSKPVRSDEWHRRLRRYWDVAETRYVTPSFTVMTGDKDDPRFDEFYLAGSELRAFMALFLVNLPSYTGLGFELRDIHTEPAPNEYYSKLYVFQESQGPKATNGPYRFGRNGHLFHNLTRIRLFAEELFSSGADGPTLRRGRVRWLRPPDPTESDRLLAWTIDPPAADGRGADGALEPGGQLGGVGAPGRLLFLANSDTEDAVENFNVPWGIDLGLDARPELLFTTHPEARPAIPGSTVGTASPTSGETAGPDAGASDTAAAGAVATKRGVKILRLEAGECRVYRVGAAG